MQTVWKVLVGLAVVVPLGAYAAGALAESASSEQRPRETIQIQEADPTPTRATQPRQTPRPPAETGNEGRADEPEDDADDDVEVIPPDYDDVDDDDDWGDDDRRDDDHSGPGRNGDDDGDRDDDNSGHGGDDDSGRGGGDD